MNRSPSFLLLVALTACSTSDATPGGSSDGSAGDRGWTDVAKDSDQSDSADATSASFDAAESSDGVAEGDASGVAPSNDASDDARSDATFAADGGVTIAEYTIPVPTGGGVRDPRGIALGPDGNIWFTEYLASNIGRITSSGVITEFPVMGVYLPSIVAGSDGALWFTDSAASHLGRITTSGSVSYFSTGLDAGPGDSGAAITGQEIAAGPDGNLWFTVWLRDKIGRMSVSGTTDVFTVLTSNARLRGIAIGPGGLWYAMLNAERIGLMTVTGAATEYSLPARATDAGAGTTAGTVRVIAGPDGNVWYSRVYLGRITPGGVATEFAVPTACAGVISIAAGADGNLWFTEDQANKIGRCTPSGIITEFAGPQPVRGPPGSRPDLETCSGSRNSRLAKSVS